jgi:uncharacterized protein
LQGDEEKGPNRTCVATRAVLPIDQLIRFVLGPEGQLVPDLKAKLPGRGVWVTASHEAVTDAVKRKAFARSLKQPVVMPEGLARMVEDLMAADARQSLAMANKAGMVITGFAKVEQAIARGGVSALIIARDGGDDGRRKVLQAVKRQHGNTDAIPVFRPFDSCEMDLALGRENAIHAALLTGPASDAFVKRLLRLERYRQDAFNETGPDAEDKPASTGPFALEN